MSRSNVARTALVLITLAVMVSTCALQPAQAQVGRSSNRSRGPATRPGIAGRPATRRVAAPEQRRRHTERTDLERIAPAEVTGAAGVGLPLAHPT